MKLLLLLALWSSAQAAPKNEIVIGFNPAENATAIQATGRRFSDYIQKAIGVSVKTFVSSDYTALIEAMRSHQVDIGFLPPFSLIKAEEMAGAKILLKAARHGKNFFYSGIIVRADKPWTKIEDLKGKNIAWVDPASTSGFIIPKASLLGKKIDPDNFFGKQIFAGGHDSVVLAVLNGTVDAGATFVNDTKGLDGAWQIFLNKVDAKKIKMIFVSEPIANEAMTTTEKFQKENPELVKKMVKILANMGKHPEGKKILKELYNIDAMIPASTKDYDTVRTAAKLLGIK